MIQFQSEDEKGKKKRNHPNNDSTSLKFTYK